MEAILGAYSESNKENINLVERKVLLFCRESVLT